MRGKRHKLTPARRPIALSALLAALSGCGGNDEGGVSRAATPPPRPPPATTGTPSKQRTADLPAMTTAQATDRAQRVALVTARGSRVVEGAPGTPFTRTTFAVGEQIKGRLPARFAVQVIGGRLGTIEVTSPVQPFVTGRRYILFLGRDGPAGPTIMPQAVLQVRAAGGEQVVQPAPDGLPSLSAGTNRPARRSASGPRLDDVLYSIRRYVRQREASP